MTADQTAKGKALAAAWKPKHGPRAEEKPAPDDKPGTEGKPRP